jgi:hypothetical protein
VATKITSLKPKADNDKYCEHFTGRVKGIHDGPYKDVLSLNAVWVRYHFHERFEHTKHSEKWIPVPVGGARFTTNAPPPTCLLVQFVYCHYLRGTGTTG